MSIDKYTTCIYKWLAKGVLMGCEESQVKGGSWLGAFCRSFSPASEREARIATMANALP
jgi:hypothetical protein